MRFNIYARKGDLKVEFSIRSKNIFTAYESCDKILQNSFKLFYQKTNGEYELTVLKVK